MMKNLIRLWTTFILIISYGFAASAETHADARGKIEYLLAIDRLDFYTQNLTDFLDGKKSSEVIQALRDLKPEDFYQQKLTFQELNDTKKWQSLVYNALIKKHSGLAVSYNDLEWNYDFFKNKMAQRFTTKDSAFKPTASDARVKAAKVIARSVPHIKGDKVLLDTDRYIAEKTSRAIIWDAILNNRDFAFFVGTQADFQETVQANKLEIVAEIKPMAQNYNKIYLTFNPQTQRYSYAMNLISGDDRIKHLSAQLRLISFGGKSYLSKVHDKVLVYGSATDFHKSQEAILTDLFNNLPIADKIVIGQKGAIDDVIKTAGMREVISKDMATVVKEMGLDKNKQSKFSDLMSKVNEISAFTNDLSLNGSVLDGAYEKAKDPVQRTYSQFDSEQASHDFTDYLLQDKDGQIKRWRVFSAIWGDEIIPIARALKNAGTKDVVYIGTAGAIASRGLKVGDVIAGDHVYTHSGKKLHFSEGKLAPKGARPFGIGQVYTPFDETNRWLDTTAKHFDAVEVETGYLREELGKEVKLEAYFLISDVVGSEGESLAHAAQNSSRRKRGQLKLLENLFVQNGIVAPVSNYELLPTNMNLKAMYEKLRTLRPSREELSLLQVAQLALKQGKSTTAELEALLKSQPTFTRLEITEALLSLGSLLAEIQPHLASERAVGVISQELFDGSFNPKKKVVLKIMAEGLHNQDAIIERIGRAKWQSYVTTLSKYFDVKVVDASDKEAHTAKRFKVQNANVFARQIEKMVLNPATFAMEMDKNGQYRLRSMPGIDRGLRCERLFL